MDKQHIISPKYSVYFLCVIKKLSDMQIIVFNFQAVCINEQIGYPDHILNDTRLNERYEEVSKLSFLIYSRI